MRFVSFLPLALVGCASAPPPSVKVPSVASVNAPSNQDAPAPLVRRQALNVAQLPCPAPARDPEQQRRVARLHQQACDGADAEGCMSAAQDYLCAPDKSSPHALSALEHGCALGAAPACTNAGLMLSQGADGVAKDPFRAAPLLQRACDGGDVAGCANLGWLYALGTGVPVDVDKAEQLSLGACRRGSMVGCSNVGWLAMNAHDGARALEYSQRACDGNHMPACANLGVLYMRGLGVGVDASKAVGYMQRGCDGGDATACANLGAFYINGVGVGRDVTRGAAIMKRACDSGNLPACDNYGVLYHEGLGVPKDTSKAEALFKRACDGGLGSACTHLANLEKEAAPN